MLLLIATMAATPTTAAHLLGGGGAGQEKLDGQKEPLIGGPSGIGPPDTYPWGPKPSPQPNIIMGPGGVGPEWTWPTPSPTFPSVGPGDTTVTPPDYLRITGWRQCTKTQRNGSSRQVCLPAHNYGCPWTIYYRLMNASLPRCRYEPPTPPPTPSPEPAVGPGGTPPTYMTIKGWQDCTTRQPSHPHEHLTNNPAQLTVVCLPQETIPRGCNPKVYWKLMFYAPDIHFCRAQCDYHCPVCT